MRTSNSDGYRKRTRGLGARFCCFVLGIAIMLIVGCGGDDRVSAVTGTVTLDGEPIADATLTFMPKEGGRPGFGITDANGAFTLTTFAEGDGAAHGVHVVTITAVEEKVSEKAEELAEEFGSLSEVMQPRRAPKQIWRVPERYSESDTSGLEFDVKRGEKNVAEFSLTTKPK